MSNSPSRVSTSRSPHRSVERPAYTVLSTIKTPPAPLIRSRQNIHEDLSVPGPGTYDISTQWSGNALQWHQEINNKQTKGQSGKDASPSELSPVKSQLSTRTTSFGAKFTSKIEESPGPGQYNPKSPDQKVSPRISCTFGVGHNSARRSRTDVETSPGPGSYDVPTPKRGGVTLKSRLTHGSFDTPGPGQYEVKSIIGTGLSKTMGGKWHH